MGHYPNWLFSVFSFIGFILVLIPLPWHLQAWNAGTCLFMVWTAVACLNFFINSIIWNNSAINYAPVWCDISTRITVGVQIAIHAAVLCILRRLYHIATLRAMGRTQPEKRREAIIDLSIGLGIPIVEMVLEIISEGHRFNIYQEVGCLPAIYTTWVSILTVSVPPLAISLVSAVYAFLTIRAFYKTRAELKTSLSVYSKLTASRYLRLIALCSCTIILMIPLSTYALYANIATGGVHPWISWEDTHLGYSQIDLFPSALWRADPIVEFTTDITRWLCVVSACLFFIFFGFSEEARGNYLAVINSLIGHTNMISMSLGSLGGIPSFHTDRGTVGTPSLSGYNNSPSLSFSDMVSMSKNGNTVPKSSTPTPKRGFIARILRRSKANDPCMPRHYDDVILPDIGGAFTEKKSVKNSSSPVSQRLSSVSILSIPESAFTHSTNQTR